MPSRGDIVLGNTKGKDLFLPLRYANRHGLISGATGSGKTVTVQLLAEQFSKAGVSVILPDIKGDLTGLARPGEFSLQIQEALVKRDQIEPQWARNPVRLWSVGSFPKSATNLQTSLQTFGPLLLANILGLNEIQTSLLQIVFRIVREKNAVVKDLVGLREFIGWIQKNRANLTSEYGAISENSLAVLIRELLVLDEQAAGKFITGFDTPLSDLITESETLGVINLIDATQLLRNPELYACMFCWLITRLYEELPEVGDLPQPKLVIFIDEAHLLFETLGKSLQENLQRIVRLIRSRGVGVYFSTQLPTDLPDSVLAQLGHRVQHVLRAFTPRDKKAVSVSAQTMRPNPAFNMETAITSLAPGEGLVSFLDGDGVPSVTQRVWISVPASFIGKGGSDSIFLHAIESKSTLNVRDALISNSRDFKDSPTVEVIRESSMFQSFNSSPSLSGSVTEAIFNGLFVTLRWIMRLKK